MQHVSQKGCVLFHREVEEGIRKYIFSFPFIFSNSSSGELHQDAWSTMAFVNPFFYLFLFYTYGVGDKPRVRNIF